MAKNGASGTAKLGNCNRIVTKDRRTGLWTKRKAYYVVKKKMDDQ